MGQSIEITFEDSFGNQASVAVVPPSDFVQTPWSLDLDVAGFDRETVVRLTFNATQLMPAADTDFQQLHFTPDIQLGDVSINQCMNHTPKNMQGESLINCLHWFKCAQASTPLAPA